MSATKPKPSSSSQRTVSSSSASGRQFASRPPQLGGPSSSSYANPSALTASTTPTPHTQPQAQHYVQPQPSQSSFPHSRATFEPTVHQTLPSYPAPRPMRPDEIILSENGSPVANPLSLSAGNSTPFFSFGKDFLTQQTNASAHFKELDITGSRDRDSSSTTGTRSSTLTAVNSIGNMRDSGSTAVFGSGLMLQLKTANGGFVAFDPLQTMPGEFDSRELTKA